MIESREGCGPLELTRRRRGQIPLRTTLSQIPLKSFGFPGAESARKRFFLRGQAPLRKNQRPGATNRNLRFRLVGREATCLPFGQATFPPRRSPASIGSREGSHLLELSGAVLAEILVFDDAGCPLGDTVSDGAGYSLDGFVFDDTSVRRSAPLHPLGGRGREGCDPLALSRSCSGGDIRSRRCRLFSWTALFPTARAWGALLPYPTRVTGCERSAALSSSPGTVLVETFVSDDAGCSPDGFCFRRRGRGALCSPTPPWVTAARGVRPSRALPGIL